MDMADRIKGMRQTPLISSSAAGVSASDPIQRSFGLLSALRRNVPAMDMPGLSRLEQAANMVGMMRGGMGNMLGGSGGLGNILGGAGGLSNMLGNMGNLGNLSSMMNNLGSAAAQAAPATAESVPAPAAKAAAPLADNINNMLSGMDESQKRRLVELAQGFANQFKK
ncbi:MAG: hypothetical protein PHD32_12155 [Eubacteriales bacterium]|nr:hypothetical protein [Eubacteriales bacterium]